MYREVKKILDTTLAVPTVRQKRVWYPKKEKSSSRGGTIALKGKK
jgi:hypothetical protein